MTSKSEELAEIVREHAMPVLNDMGELAPHKGYRLSETQVPAHLERTANRLFGVPVPGAYMSEAHYYHLTTAQYRSRGGR